MSTRTLLLFSTMLVSGACSSDAAPPSEKPVDNGPTRKVAGVFPDRFECSSIMTLSALTELLGAPAKAMDTPAATTPGLPRPCNYELASQPPEYWTFDFDCRPNYKTTADALFSQYKEINNSRIEEYNKVSDAGVPKAPKGATDAAVVYVQPGSAADVDVGAKALDHNDQGLLFIDDDAPCYVRVIGPDASKRLALAKQIAKNLTYVNAPMTPRSMK